MKTTCAVEMVVNEKLEDSISYKSLLEACGECMSHQFYSSFERFRALKGLQRLKQIVSQTKQDSLQYSSEMVLSLLVLYHCHINVVTSIRKSRERVTYRDSCCSCNLIGPQDICIAEQVLLTHGIRHSLPPPHRRFRLPD